MEDLREEEERLKKRKCAPTPRFFFPVLGN
jgi:hypothetical protein